MDEMDSSDQPKHSEEPTPAEDASLHGRGVSVPRQQELRWPLVVALRDLGGAAHKNDIQERVIVLLELTEQQAAIEVPSGARTKLRDRLNWAGNELKHHQVLTYPSPGYSELTSLGRTISESQLESLFRRTTLTGPGTTSARDLAPLVEQFRRNTGYPTAKHEEQNRLRAEWREHLLPENIERLNDQKLAALLGNSQWGSADYSGGRYVSVEPAEIPGHSQVSAGHYVGSISVDGIHVLVRPKIPLRNLFLLLEVGLREQDWRDEAALYETSHDLLPALMSFFARTAETTLARGLYHSYREQHDRLVALRGRVDVARQLTRPGIAIPTACTFTEFTADLIENSYMKAAVSRSLHVAGVQPADRHRLMRHLVTLEDVGDVRHHPRDFDDVVFTRLNEHYRPALRLARLVLENLTLRDAFGDVSASSFMLDMNELFERFITERLRRALRGRLAVKDQHQDRLDEDGSVKFQPDLLFGPERSPSFVADIKYKLTDEAAGGSNADLYQLLAYTTALDLPEGMLIYCLDAEDPNGDPDSYRFLEANPSGMVAPVAAGPAKTAAVSSVRVRHTGTVLHTYALDLSGTPEVIGRNMSALADWIADRATGADSATTPAALTA